MKYALLPRPNFGTLTVSGRDRTQWFNGLSTCDVTRAVPGQSAWGLLLDERGKIQSEHWLLEDGQRLYVSTSPGTTERVHRELDKRLVMEDAELTDESAAWCWYAIYGPQAGEVGRRWVAPTGGLFGILEPAVEGEVAVSVNNAEHCVLLLPRGQRLPDDPELHEFDSAAWDAFRLARGLPEFGLDYTTSDRPHEASLDRRAVSWTKGCYLGQEVVCMQEMRGKVKRRLEVLWVNPGGTGISAESRSQGPRTGDRVVDEQQQDVGVVTSCAFDAERERWLVMAKMQPARDLHARNAQLAVVIVAEGVERSLKVVGVAP